ncbi:hypothetical protein O181_021328 [Austropuccinia psidii MF-1]|uniref:Reverse transcriptase Ty1/copia-type domain-containing protein n=1 Tax=Austropuccinia psidii MF-1 TaxID=1389203 RepID=A0A9Q3GVC5_9BASI|nr:hypothetical protein [Austropuccinia psidii MF-1]
MHGCLIFWKTRKQPSVSISTAEAEYKSLCDLTSELLWFRQWCQEAEIYQFDKAIIVWEDNKSCISTANGNCKLNNKQMKHVDIQLHFFKEAVKSNFIKLQYAPTLEMLADFLTKSVTKTNLQHALTSLGVCGLGVRGGVKNQAMMSLESPGIQHWQEFLHVLKYIKGTCTIGLTYCRDNQEPPTAYLDADWGNCRVCRCSVTGYLITIHNNLVILKMRKQPTVSLSSAEAEYKALTDLACELIWFKQLYKEISINTEDKPIAVHEDSQG